MSLSPTAGAPAASIRAALLWDVDRAGVDTARHLEFLVGRVLGHGSIDDIRALRLRAGDDALRDYLARTRGRRICRRRLRYLAAILDIERAAVDSWIADPARRVWDER